MLFSQDVKNLPDQGKQKTALIVPTEQKELEAKKKAAEENIDEEAAKKYK